jgi:hypothetical protein
MFERALINNGFSPLSIEALAGSAYTVWTKKSE